MKKKQDFFESLSPLVVVIFVSTMLWTISMVLFLQSRSTPTSTAQPALPIPEQPVYCIQVYEPVCGVNKTTYGNECEAMVAGVPIQHAGACSSPSR